MAVSSERLNGAHHPEPTEPHGFLLSKHAWIPRNSREVWLEEAQAGIKIAGRNINYLRYAMAPPLWQKVKRN